MGDLGGLFQPISDAFFWLLEFLHTHLGLSWSWSIVLLTVIVRVVLVPLTWRQLKSMRVMQALQPEIKRLQDKYKNDRDTLNQKTMEFYKDNKVSPFGSCLPLILQLPVFFGLYYMLREQGQAGGAFAKEVVDWLWINDITQFDYYLMFVYIASQFVASWQTARKGAGQQKVIAYFMPIMVGIFMFIGKWPAGLFIYWCTSNLWTIAQQYVAEKALPAPMPAIEAPAKVASSKQASTKAAPAKAGTAKAGVAKTGTDKVPPSRTTTIDMKQNQSEMVTLKPRKLLLSIKEASEITSMSPSKCREMAHSGEWEAIHIGASLRIVAESLEEWISRQERVA